MTGELLDQLGESKAFYEKMSIVGRRAFTSWAQRMAARAEPSCLESLFCGFFWSSMYPVDCNVTGKAGEAEPAK